MRKSFALPVLLISQFHQCIAYTPGMHSTTKPSTFKPHSLTSSYKASHVINRDHSLRMTLGAGDEISRRGVMKQAAAIFLISSGANLSLSSPANAKEKVPVTREAISQAFQAVRYELESPEGGVKNLEELVAKEDFEGILEFTKYYDLEFRKAKMVKARKLALTSKELKDRAVSNCNAVTFDLIGMSKGSRPGQRDMNEVRRYFGELKVDIATFLEMEKEIDFSVLDL